SGETAQIFEINHLEEILNNAHICDGGRLKFVRDIEIRIYTASTISGVGYNSIDYLMSMLCFRPGQNARNKSEDEIMEHMRKKCLASFFHHIKSPDRNKQHEHCPDGLNSWCAYKRSLLDPEYKSIDEKKQELCLDPIFSQILDKMINDLTNSELLRRCVKGLTQNSNESINFIVWSIIAKNKYHNYTSIRGAAATAVIIFNSGQCGLLEFLETTGIKINPSLLYGTLGKDDKRIEKADAAIMQQQKIKQQKEKQRQQSIAAEIATQEYYPGLH
ncbi:unnamed protein product, partial [Didymodactylos carnosus]